MTESEMGAIHQKIYPGARTAIAQALERHRKLGEAIAVWQDGKVVVLLAEQSPQLDKDSQIREGA